jgi:hypothetical protein
MISGPPLPLALIRTPELVYGSEKGEQVANGIRRSSLESKPSIESRWSAAVVIVCSTFWRKLLGVWQTGPAVAILEPW